MKKLILLFTAALISAFSFSSSAQLVMPQASSSQTLTQEFGLGTITVKYSRPNLRGRNVFADLAPYGEVWRTGANTATLISFTDDVKLEGNDVKAGDYALFTIPGRDVWTIILNKDTKQWGAYQYNPANDALRFQVKPSTQNTKTETFTISFSDVYATTAKLNLSWDHALVSINMVSSDIDSRVMASIDKAMQSDKKPYLPSAIYYYENNKDLNKALEWVNSAEQADPKAPWLKYWKARIQLKAGDKNGAAVTAAAGIEAAKAMNNAEYVRLNSAVLEEARK